jgi:hypothetical protein
MLGDHWNLMEADIEGGETPQFVDEWNQFYAGEPMATEIQMFQMRPVYSL